MKIISGNYAPIYGRIHMHLRIYGKNGDALLEMRGIKWKKIPSLKI